MLIVSLLDYSKEELLEISLIEVAYELLKDKKEAMAFKDIMDEIQNLLGISEKEVKAKIAQFYTDINIDGRFLGLGDNRWGLRVWYPIEQVEEDVVTEIKPKKKKSKKKAKDEDLDDYDELDEEDIDYDDIDGFDDDEEEEEEEILDDEEVDEDLLEEDEDEDLEEDLIDDEEYDLGDEDEVIEDEDLDLDEDEEDL